MAQESDHRSDVDQEETNEDNNSSMVDYTEQFTPTGPFRTRDELISWVQKVGRNSGFIIVVKKSDVGGNGRRGRVYLACERHGSYRVRCKMPETDVKGDKKRKRRSNTGTKKCDCPFLLNAKNPRDGVWTLTVVCGTHNHGSAKYLEGHSYAGRLDNDEVNVMLQMMKSNAKPKDILVTLKDRNPTNASTLRTIYNARQKQRLIESGGRSHMQQLLHLLNEANYIECHRCYDDTSIVRDIFWAHPGSLQLLKCFPRVLFMDCSYKTNRYKYPVLQVVGVTSTDMTFSVAFGYMTDEKEENFMWVLQKLKNLVDGWPLPEVIVTDKDLALMSAIKRVFPEAINLFSMSHVDKNVMANIKEKFTKSSEFQEFVQKWNELVYASNEFEYYRQIDLLETEYGTVQGLIPHLRSAWLNQYKEKFVTAWTNDVLHFGNTNTNNAENAHEKLKKFLCTSQGNFVTLWTTIDSMIELQHLEIKASFERSLTVVVDKYQDPIFTQLRGLISKVALDKIWEELQRVPSVGVDRDSCGCVLRRTHGLPCAHELALYQHDQLPIPFGDINSHWQKLNMTPKKCDLQRDFNFKEVTQKVVEKYENSDEVGRATIVQKLIEIAAFSTTSTVVPLEKD
ncbi:hypothetical protein Syun_013557 [Stephania yunnanensis]|uniref:SWIM-type domain-containing protein n=1 Tax=Stephania yunnanensis TaxID=152371 RepID=A0AAP0P7Q0_9MAGN